MKQAIEETASVKDLAKKLRDGYERGTESVKVVDDFIKGEWKRIADLYENACDTEIVLKIIECDFEGNYLNFVNPDGYGQRGWNERQLGFIFDLLKKHLSQKRIGAMLEELKELRNDFKETERELRASLIEKINLDFAENEMTAGLLVRKMLNLDERVERLVEVDSDKLAKISDHLLYRICFFTELHGCYENGDENEERK